LVSFFYDDNDRVREENEMLLIGILGTVLLIASVGLVILLSGANETPGRVAIGRPAGVSSRRLKE
jgi:hypothetical protein